MTAPVERRHQAILATAWIALLLGAVTVGRRYGGDLQHYRVRSPIVVAQGTTSGWKPGGREIALVYVGSPACAYSNSPQLRKMLDSAANALHSEADAQGASFVRVGISVGGNLVDGLQHLERTGRFDEVVAGRGWHNLGALRFIHGAAGGHSGGSVTPQLLVVARSAVDSRVPGLQSETVVLRLAGLAAIDRWLAAGAQIAWTSPVTMAP